MKTTRSLSLPCAMALLALALPAAAMQQPNKVDPSRGGTGSAPVNPMSETFNLAIEQTVFARAALYHPSAAMLDQLSEAAASMLTYTSALDDAHRIALVARLFGPGGLMDQHWDLKGTKKGEDANQTVINAIKDGTKHALQAMLTAVKDKKGTGHDRTCFVALVGDIGALVQDAAGDKGPGEPARSLATIKGILTTFAAHIAKGHNAGKTLEDVKRSLTAAKKAGGSAAMGPTKSFVKDLQPGERGTGPMAPPRTGIHNVGQLIDTSGGITAGQITSSEWPLLTIAEERLNRTTEPLAGHMSGSPSEILWAWDVLAGRELAHAYVGGDATAKGVLNERAAASSAFLIATGFHSALEVLEGTMVYLGMKVARGEHGVIGTRGDLGDLFYGDAATKLVSELMEGSTDLSKSPKPRDWLALVYEHIPGGAEGYVGSSSDPNDYLINFTDPKWAEFKKLSDVEAALKDKKAPKLHCYIGGARCTVHSVQIASGSSSGSATIKTVGLKVKYGSNTKVIFHGSH